MSTGAGRWAALAVGLAIVAGALGGKAHAQGAPPLRVHTSATPGAPGDTTGMRRLPVASEPGQTAWVGTAVLDLPAEDLLTVGLEQEADRTATLSLWLADASASAFADLTRRSIGRALAVVYGGEVLATPVVQSEIANGHVLITGLTPADGARIARRLRGDETATASPPAAVSPTTVPRRPVTGREPAPGDVVTAPPRVNPADVAPAGGEGVRARPPSTAPAEPAVSVAAVPMVASPSSPSVPAAEAAAQAFVAAIARRDWRAAAGALHPDALARLRTEALGILRADRRGVRVDDGRTSGRLRPESVLGRPLPGRDLSALPDLDLATLYLAGLDVLGVWGRPAPARTLVGTLADGADLVHVLLRAEGAARGGVSDVTVVTLRRDASGQWRPLLTQAQGF